MHNKLDELTSLEKKETCQESNITKPVGVLWAMKSLLKTLCFVMLLVYTVNYKDAMYALYVIGVIYLQLIF